jgi:hypothetical protein
LKEQFLTFQSFTDPSLGQDVAEILKEKNIAKNTFKKITSW